MSPDERFADLERRVVDLEAMVEHLRWLTFGADDD